MPQLKQESAQSPGDAVTASDLSNEERTRPVPKSLKPSHDSSADPKSPPITATQPLKASKGKSVPSSVESGADAKIKSQPSQSATESQKSDHSKSSKKKTTLGSPKQASDSSVQKPNPSLQESKKASPAVSENPSMSVDASLTADENKKEGEIAKESEKAIGSETVLPASLQRDAAQLEAKTAHDEELPTTSRVDSEDSELEGEHLLMESSNDMVLPSYTRKAEEDEQDALTAPTGATPAAVSPDTPLSLSLQGHGNALLEQAERMICQHLLVYRDRYLWREFLPHASQTSVHNIMNSMHDMQLPTEVFSAICIRFGPAYETLQDDLNKVETSPLQTDRSFQTKKLLDAFSSKRLIHLCNRKTVINVKSLEHFLTSCQAVISLIHVQLQRCTNVIAKKKMEKFTILQVLRVCGLPQLSEYYCEMFTSHFNINVTSPQHLVETMKQYANRLEEDSYLTLIKCIRVLQGPVEEYQDHVLSILERNAFNIAVLAPYKLTPSFMQALERLCLQKHAKDGSTLAVDDLCALLYPCLMSVRCLTPIGSIIISHKLSPRSTIHQCLVQLNNKYQLKFRQIFPHEKLPSDVRYYFSDATKEKLEEIIPSDRMLCSAFCEVQHIIIESLYTYDLYEAKLAATENAGTGRNAKPLSGTTEPTPQATIRTLQEPNVIQLPKVKKFPYPAHTCHNWSVIVMIEYLSTVIELPQYEENFLRYEINGYGFLCLDNKLCRKTCGIDNALHAAKINLHAEKLRKKVFTSAMSSLPDDMTHWHPVHLAAYLHSMELYGAALVVMRRQLDGSTLISTSHEGLVAQLQTVCSPPDIENAIVVFNTLKKKFYKAPVLPKPPSSSKKNIQLEKSVKQKPKTTAMKIRRLKQKENEQQCSAPREDNAEGEGSVGDVDNDENADYDSEVSDEEEPPPAYADDKSESRQVIDAARDKTVHSAPQPPPIPDEIAKVSSPETRGKKRTKKVKTVTLPATTSEALVEPASGGLQKHEQRSRNSVKDKDSDAMEHVRSLRRIVDQHAAIVKQLKNENRKLLQDKAAIKNKLADLERDSKGSQTTVQHALRERDEAIKALGYVSEKFVQEVTYDLPSQGEETRQASQRRTEERPRDQIAVAPAADMPQRSPTALKRSTITPSPVDPVETLREIQKDARKPSVNIVQSMESESRNEIKRCRSLMKSLTIPLESPIDTDTIRLLRSVGLGWTRAGRSICARSQVESEEHVEYLQGLVKCADAWRIDLPKHHKDSNPYKKYVANCYASAVMYRILRKFSSDSLHIAHLLQQVREGFLPIVELSRTDFSDFLNEQFHYKESWHDLDALYQKLDPDRNGFISLEHTFVNLQELLPYSGFYLSLHERQQAMLFLFTIISCFLANQKQSMESIIQQLLLSHRDVSGIRTYLVEGERNTLSDIRFLADMFLVMATPFFEELKHVAGHCDKVIKFLSADLKSSCGMLAQMLNPTGDVVSYLSTVLVTFIEFRIKALSQQDVVSKRSLMQQLQITLSALLGVSKAKAMEEKTNDIPVHDFEMAIASMLGIPLPHGASDTPLMTCQSSVEDSLLDVASAVLRHRESSQKVTRLDTRSSRRMENTRYDNSVVGISQETRPPSPTKSIDPIELYFEHLTEKLNRRRKILKGLLEVYREVTAIKKRGVDGDIYSSFDDLLKRSRGLQSLLLRDMRAKVSTRDQQIEEQARKLLSKSVHQGSKKATDVESTEGRILQTNEDALLLIEKIEKELQA